MITTQVIEPSRVDPALLARIEDAAAPRRALGKLVPLPASIPGSTGVVEVLRMIVGATRHGADWFVGERERLGEIHAGRHAEQPAVFLWNAQEIQRVLRNEERAWSTGLGWLDVILARVGPAENSGALLALDFEPHRDARKLVQAAFTPRAMQGYAEIARPRIEAAVNGWLARGEVAFKREARVLLADVANEIFTGVQSAAERARIDDALTRTWLGVRALSSNPRLSPTLRRARGNYAYMEQLFGGLLRQRRERPGRDLLSHLARAGDPDGRDDRALLGIFMNIMIGAYDTTSLAVTNMAALLAKHLPWQERLRAGLQRADEREGVQRLEELDWAWKESLRILPVTGYSPRRTLRDLELLGHRLRAGTFVALMIGPQGRSRAYWDEPLRFDPERFSPTRFDERARAAYMPFGGGPHACIGMQLATLEARMLFQELLRRTRFSATSDAPLRHTYAPLGQVQGPVALRVRPLR